MGLMDKFKNLFTDEEIIEEEDVEPVEIKEVKKEEEVHQLPTFMREKIEKEEKVQEKKPTFMSENVEVKRELKIENISIADDKSDLSVKEEEPHGFKFPIDISDNDFIETRSRQSLHQQREVVNTPPVRPVNRDTSSREKSLKPETKVADLYKDKKEKKCEEKARTFKATPIISPIYGVLDKNYTPVDMEKTEVNNLEEHRHSKNVDFDSVRKKAYGTLTEEIKENLMCENCEYLKEAKECKKERIQKQKNDLLYDVLEDDADEYGFRKDITLDEATENYYDYGVAYSKESNIDYEDSHIDYEEKSPIIVNHEQEEEVRPQPKKEIPPVKSSINLLSTLKKSMGDEVPVEKKADKDLELTDDLFNLIDSMYDEREDDK